MNSESSSHSTGISIHIPVAILSAAVAIYFGVQLRNTNKQAEIMRWQSDNLGKQEETLKAIQQKNADTISKSEDTMKQAEQIQTQYVNLFNDLLDLAKDDKDAKEVVEKFGIKRADTAKTDPAPAEDDAQKKDK